MKKKRVLLLCVIAAALLLSVLLLRRPSNEPSYDGHPLSYWVSRLGRFGTDEDITYADRQKSQEAIDHIGVAALPFLLKWIHYDPPRKWRTTLGYRLAANQLPFANRLFFWIAEPTGEQLSLGVDDAFLVLGNRAAPVFNELCRLLNQTNTPQASSIAAFALACVGTNSLPPLLTVVTNPMHPARISAIAAIGSMTNLEDSTQLAVAVITDSLRCSNKGVQLTAIEALGELKASPQTSIPVIIPFLTNTTRIVRLNSAEALGKFGPQARSAIPALTSAATDPDPDVRRSVIEALQKIAPGVPTNTPAQ